MCTTMMQSLMTFCQTLDYQFVPDTVQVENVHLSHSLMTLAYKINEAEVEREKKDKSESIGQIEE